MKCEHCPIKSGTCIGETESITWACRFAASNDPIKIAAVIASSKPSGSEPEPVKDPGHAEPVVVAAEQSVRDRRRAEAQRRAERTKGGCGCGNRGSGG